MHEKQSDDNVTARSERTQLLRKQARDRIELWNYFKEAYPETDFSNDDDLTEEQEIVWNELEVILNAWHQAELDLAAVENTHR